MIVIVWSVATLTLILICVVICLIILTIFLYVNNFARANVLFPDGVTHTYCNLALNQFNKLDYFVNDNVTVIPST